MEAVDALKSVLCGPDGKCCIAGSQADRDTVDTALAAIQHYLDQHKAELPEPVAWLANYGGNVYTEAQLKQAVRDALDALKDVAQTLAWTQHGECRGFSDGLLTTDEALDKARDALSKYKGGKA